MEQANFKRDERILILPHNTLRFVDVMYELELMHGAGMKIPDFDTAIFKSVNRKNKDFTSKYNLGQLENKLMTEWYKYYDVAPRTNFYKYLDIMKHQKFIDKIDVLFSDARATDPAFNNIYYDGTIDGLESCIIDGKYTAIVLDDIHLMKELSDRGNVDMNNMTFFISKVGYNYELRDGDLKPKKELYEVEKKYAIEMAVVSLFDFSKELIDKMRNN